jgi:hypothetical protein
MSDIIDRFQACVDSSASVIDKTDNVKPIEYTPGASQNLMVRQTTVILYDHGVLC